MDQWFDDVKMTFAFDNRDYAVHLSDAIRSHGIFARIDGANPVTLQQFQSPQEFESVMSSFFMGELGLQGIVNHVTTQTGAGAEQPHGWPWLATAMIIEPDPKATFGSVAFGSMPTRIMQMYLGIPWINTINDIKAAESRLKGETKRDASALQRTAYLAEQRVNELDADLTARREELKKYPDAEKLRKQIAEANIEYAQAEERHRRLLSSQKEVEDQLTAAKEAYGEARAKLQEFKDCRDAGFVFRKLKPVCCPSCDEVFSEYRASETAKTKVCLVCNTPEKVSDDTAGAEGILQLAVKEAESVLRIHERASKRLNDGIASAAQNMSAAEATCSRLAQELRGNSARSEIETAIIRFEAQIEELQRNPAPATAPEIDEAKILGAAVAITEGAFKPKQMEVLKKVLVQHPFCKLATA